MNKYESADSKYLFLWISVFVVATIIFGGWIFSAKYNIDKINRENKEANFSNSDVSVEIESIFKKVEKKLEKENNNNSNLQIANFDNLKNEEEQKNKKEDVVDFDSSAELLDNKE